MPLIFGNPHLPNPLDFSFIETSDAESEAQWVAACEELLINLDGEPKCNWWHSFTAGPVVEWSNRKFRAFRCPTRSAIMHLWRQSRRRSLPRALLFLGHHEGDSNVTMIIVEGAAEKEFDGEPISEQLHRIGK